MREQKIKIINLNTAAPNKKAVKLNFFLGSGQFFY